MAVRENANIHESTREQIVEDAGSSSGGGIKGGGWERPETGATEEVQEPAQPSAGGNLLGDIQGDFSNEAQQRQAETFESPVEKQQRQQQRQQEQVREQPQDRAVPAVSAEEVSKQNSGLAPQVESRQETPTAAAASEDVSSEDILADVQVPVRGANYVAMDSSWSKAERPSVWRGQIRKPEGRRAEAEREPSEPKPVEALQQKEEDDEQEFQDAPKTPEQAMAKPKKDIFEPVKRSFDQVVSGVRNRRTSRSARQFYEHTAKRIISEKNYQAQAAYGKITGDARLDIDEVSIGTEFVRAALMIPNGKFAAYIEANTGVQLSENIEEAIAQVGEALANNDVQVGVFKSPNLEPESSSRAYLKMHEGTDIRMNPMRFKAFNADTDGDDCCVSFQEAAMRRCVDPLDYLINLAGDLTLDPDFMPFRLPNSFDLRQDGEIRRATLDYIEQSIMTDSPDLARAICDMYLAKPDDREDAVREFVRNAYGYAHAGDNREWKRALSDVLSRTYRDLRTLSIAQFGYGREHETSEELLQDTPRPVTAADRNLFEFTRCVLDDALVDAKRVANFQDLRVMMHDYLGEPEGTNPSFRFTANVAKLFVNYDDRMQIGSDEVRTSEDGSEVVVSGHALMRGVLKFVESRVIRNQLDTKERQKEARETLVTKIREEVGDENLPVNGEGRKEFMTKFIEVYNANVALINASNITITTDWRMSQGKGFRKLETVGDIAAALRDVYGDRLTIRDLLRPDQFIETGETRTDESGKLFINKVYGSWTLDKFAKENKYFEQGVDLEEVSNLRHHATMGNIIRALADKRGSTASKYNQDVYDRKDSVCNRMCDLLKGTNPASVDLYQRMEILNLSDPDVWAYFGMDNWEGFVESKYGKALRSADVETVKTVRLAMTVEYRMSRIHELEHPTEGMYKNAEDLVEELAYQEDKLASSSWAWQAIIRDRRAAANGERRTFDRLKAGERHMGILGREKTGAHYDHWTELGGYDSLEEVLLSLDLTKDDKCQILRDVVSVEQSFLLSEYMMPEFLERNPYSTYSSGAITSVGIMSATNDFNQAYDRWERQQGKLLADVIDARKKSRHGQLEAHLARFREHPRDFVELQKDTIVDAMCAVLEKTYLQSEKSKQHPFTNALYQCLSLVKNGGFFSDVYHTDDKAVGLQPLDKLSPMDIAMLLADPDKSLWVYDEAGRKACVDREFLVGMENPSEDDLWDFLVEYPNVAACLRTHQASVLPDGSAYLGATNSLANSMLAPLPEDNEETNDAIYTLVDDPSFCALVALVNPLHGQKARDMRAWYLHTIDMVGRDITSHPVDSIMEAYRIDEPYLTGIGMTSQAAERLVEDVRVSLKRMQQKVRGELIDGYTEDLERPIARPDLSSCYAYYDVRQEFSGAKTDVSTGIEGFETHRLAMFLSALGCKDKYASLAEYDNFGKADKETLLNRFGACMTNYGKPLSELDDEQLNSEEIILELPEGEVRQDKSLKRAKKQQVASVYSYLIVKRDFGAEKFNLKAKKTGQDKFNSIIKHGKYFSQEELQQFDEKIDDHGELLDWLRGIYAENPENIFQVKLALAQRLKKANEIQGYTEMNLADFMNLADLMIIEREVDGKPSIDVRSLGLLARAIRANITYDLARNGTREQISEAAAEAAARAGKDKIDRQTVLQSIRPKGAAKNGGAEDPRRSSLELNLEALKNLSERTGLPYADKDKHELRFGNQEEGKAWADLVGKLSAARNQDTYFIAGFNEDAPACVGPEAVWLFTRRPTEQEQAMVKHLGVTAIMAPQYAVPDSVPFAIGDAPCVILPGFDIALNGESNPQGDGRFGVFRRPADNVVWLYEDDLNEFSLGDAGVQLFKALVNRLKVNWSSETDMTTASMFANTFKVYPEADFSCHLATEQEIEAILADGSNIMMDVGVTPGTQGFDRHWKMTMDAIDRYAENFKQRKNDFRPGGILEYGKPNDCIGFMTCIIDDPQAGRMRAFAPIIPFDQTGHNGVSHAEVPSGFRITAADYNNDEVPTQSFFRIGWEYEDDLSKHSIKFFEGQSTANKMYAAVNQAVQGGTFRGTDVAIDCATAPQTTASRRIGDNKRLGTMQTLMYMARTRGYNYASLIGDDQMFENADGEKESIKERLAHGYMSREEWAVNGVYPRADVENIAIKFSDDPKLDKWIKTELIHFATNGGNPTDYLCSQFDDNHTNIWWEFECMFETSKEYQDNLLKFLSSMDGQLCPSSTEDAREDLIFRVKPDGHDMQMQVPHKDSKGTYYSWVNAYAGWSFFNFNDFTGKSQVNVNGFSDTLDAIATHELAGRKAVDKAYRTMLERSISDIGEVKHSNFGMDVVHKGRVEPEPERAMRLDRAKYGNNILALTGHRDLGLGSLPNQQWAKIKADLKEYCQTNDVTAIISGMALGFDLVGAEVATELGIPLVCAEPYTGQEKNGFYQKNPGMLKKRQRIEDYARKTGEIVLVDTEEGYVKNTNYDKLQSRNEWMIDNADQVYAVFSGKRGGTANAVAYAQKVGAPLSIARIPELEVEAEPRDIEWNKRRGEAADIISRFRGDYAFLSNMYDSPITYNGVTYRNAEAAFQAQKAAPEVREELFGSISGKEARRLGRRVSLDKRQLQDWEIAKDDIMKEIIRQKFRDPGLAKKLANLGDAYIEEGNTWGDEYWGVSIDKGVASGENRLGKILMTVRDEIVRG